MPESEEEKDALIQRLLGEKIQLEHQVEVAQANYDLVINGRASCLKDIETYRQAWLKEKSRIDERSHEIIVEQRDAAEARYIKSQEENAAQEDEIADLTRELMAIRDRLSDREAKDIHRPMPNGYREIIVTLSALLFIAVVVVIIKSCR